MYISITNQDDEVILSIPLKAGAVAAGCEPIPFVIIQFVAFNPLEGGAVAAGISKLLAMLRSNGFFQSP